MKEIFSFLDRLAANNNREWFAANKAEYDRLRDLWTEKLQELLDAMALYDGSLAHVSAKDWHLPFCPVSCIIRILINLTI